MTSLAASFFAGSPVHAATDLWTGAVNGTWNSTDANWSNGGTNLYTNGDTVQFGDTGGANLTVNVAAAVTPASVSFTDTGAGTNAYVFGGSAINGTGTTVSLNNGFGGSVRFNVANGYTGGTTIAGGTLNVGATAALGTGAITLAGGSLQSAGGTLRTLANTSIVATASTTTSLAAASGDLTLSGALTGSGTISVNNAAAGSAWLSGNLSGFTGTLSHTNVNGGNNFFISGGADLSGAKVVLSGATTSNRRMGANSAGNVSIGELSGTGGILGAGNNAATTYTIGALNTNSTYNGTVINVGSGVASITKTGSGSLTLGGANTYSGVTTVNGGTLLVNNASGSGTGTGAINVTAGTFGGTGSATGAVTVSSGAALMGGTTLAASEDLSLSGNLTLNSGSVIKLTLGTGLTHSSLTRTGGTWTFAANQVFTFTDLGAESGTYNNIISGLAGAVTTTGWTISNADYVGTFTYDGLGGIDLTLTAVPEPHEYALGLSALLLMIVVARRRRLGAA